jgi:uncharacterized protein with FMN-binding domain
MSIGLFIRGLKSLAPALAVLLIIALIVTPTLQAAIPGVYEVSAAEPVVKEAPQEQTATATAPPVTIQKSPKKAEEADRKAPALPVFDTDLSNSVDGTYTGKGMGYAGYITVEVKIKSQAIKSIKIIKVEADDPPYMEKAKRVIDYILKAQSLDVDTVSGATFSSNGIISAVEDALNKAAGKPSKKKTSTPQTPETVVEEPGEVVVDDTDLIDQKFIDGIYTGVGIGYNGEIHVSVTILGGSISAIAVTQHQEDQPYMDNAMALISLIVQGQSVQVDTVTGATYSSRGIINAVKDALRKAVAVLTEVPELDAPESAEETIPGNVVVGPPSPELVDTIDPTVDIGYEPVLGMYVDGTYKGLARGYKSLFQATVVIVDGNIKSINMTHADDDEYYAACVGIIDRIITRQTTDGIDTVTGCTYSSKAILDSVKNALNKAKKPEMPDAKKEDEDEDKTPEPPDDEGDGGDGGDEPGPPDDGGNGGGGDEPGSPDDGGGVDNDPEDPENGDEENDGDNENNEPDTPDGDGRDNEDTNADGGDMDSGAGDDAAEDGEAEDAE